MENNGEPSEKLVTVFHTRQEPEAMVVGGLLESADIKANVTWMQGGPYMLTGLGDIVVLVPEDQADEARRIIAHFHAHPATDADATRST